MITPPPALHAAAVVTLASEDEDELGASIWETSRTARLFSEKKKQEEEEPGIKPTIVPASSGGGDEGESKCPMPAAIDVAASRKTVTFHPAVKFNNMDHEDVGAGYPTPESAKGSREKKTPRYRGISTLVLNPSVEGKSLRERKPTLFFSSEFACKEKRVARKQKLHKKEHHLAKASSQKKKAPLGLLDYSGENIKGKEAHGSGLKPSAADQIELNLTPVRGSVSKVPKSNCATSVYERKRKWRVQLRYQKHIRHFGTDGSREEAFLANQIAQERLGAMGGSTGKGCPAPATSS